MFVRYEPANSDLQQTAETKVYYYLDDDATPFVSILPVPQDLATLRDFKKVFTRKGFKYFCKGLDADIKREVKIELCDDSAPLKRSANGLIELFLHSCGVSGTIPRSGTLPRRGQTEYVHDIDFLDKPGRRRSLVNLDLLDASESTHPASSVGGTIGGLVNT
ncbi:DIX domain protein [Ancylostoma duodenale]|uniref:DIX domain protein n=1 Tax=Ancylostoma duodenale TaxID=51022 RepID=A0A0C2H0B8_9BILA|nr:DIX domain protein [Ancylostoma duodenale]